MPDTTPIQKLVGDLSPELVDLTDRVLFGDVWERIPASKEND